MEKERSGERIPTAFVEIKFPGGSCTEFTAQTPTGQIYASFIWLSYKCQDFRIDTDSLQRPRTG